MKVILSSHLPGVIDILIPIALPFRNVVELAGDLQTTMKSIEERDWLAQGYYLSYQIRLGSVLIEIEYCLFRIINFLI